MKWQLLFVSLCVCDCVCARTATADTDSEGVVNGNRNALNDSAHYYWCPCVLYGALLFVFVCSAIDHVHFIWFLLILCVRRHVLIWTKGRQIKSNHKRGDGNDDCIKFYYRNGDGLRVNGNTKSFSFISVNENVYAYAECIHKRTWTKGFIRLFGCRHLIVVKPKYFDEHTRIVNSNRKAFWSLRKRKKTKTFLSTHSTANDGIALFGLSCNSSQIRPIPLKTTHCRRGRTVESFK